MIFNYLDFTEENRLYSSKYTRTFLLNVYLKTKVKWTFKIGWNKYMKTFISNTFNEVLS